MTTSSPWTQVSLLWLDGGSDVGSQGACDPCAIADLDLEPLADALSLHARYREGVRRVLTGLCFDELSPVDAIWTHFPMAEAFSLQAGRLGEEARRLEAIFRRATPRSLILLNESLFSTSPGECLYLARDVVRALRHLGARAIYATHLHELAANVDEINRSTPGSGRVASLVATVAPAAPSEGDRTVGEDGVKPTFRIEAGPPLGLSYARQIAARYGIRYEQLVETIAGRRGGPAEGRPAAGSRAMQLTEAEEPGADGVVARDQPA